MSSFRISDNGNISFGVASGDGGALTVTINLARNEFRVSGDDVRGFAASDNINDFLQVLANAINADTNTSRSVLENTNTVRSVGEVDLEEILNDGFAANNTIAANESGFGEHFVAFSGGNFDGNLQFSFGFDDRAQAQAEAFAYAARQLLEVIDANSEALLAEGLADGTFGY